MLGKLFKHEWKRTSKMGLLMLAAVAIVTLIGVLGFVLPFASAMESESSVMGTGDSATVVIMMLVAMASIMVYIVTLMGVVYGMLIYMGVHMYRTTYSDEGYLTHTLPVKPYQIILSKVLNAGLWYGIISVGMVISVVILILSMLFFMEGPAGFAHEMDLLGKELASLNLTGSFEVIHLLVSWGCMLLITPFSAMMSLFGALTIGQLASKYRAVMGILAYFAVCMVNGIVSYIIQYVTMFGNFFVSAMADAEPSVGAMYDGTLITSVIMLVGFYFISHAIMSNKLNME